MLVGAALAGGLAVLVAGPLARRCGAVAGWSIAGLGWSLVVVALVTLVPTDPDPGIVPAEGRATTCSTDYGGPAPDGFWLLGGGQRLLNTVLFVPAGALGVLAAARWRRGFVGVLGLVPLVVLGLAVASLGIELVQLELARIDRACDVTDVVDNTVGAVLGALLGVVLAGVLRPWRRR